MYPIIIILNIKKGTLYSQNWLANRVLIFGSINLCTLSSSFPTSNRVLYMVKIGQRIECLYFEVSIYVPYHLHFRHQIGYPIQSKLQCSQLGQIFLTFYLVKSQKNLTQLGALLRFSCSLTLFCLPRHENMMPCRCVYV